MKDQPIHKTRFTELGYQFHAPGLWRIIDLTDDRHSAIGQHYPTKAALLADLERYASQFGCTHAEPYKPETKPRIERAVLVYQGGLANVFAVDSFNREDHGRNARRLIQNAFIVCEGVAQGLALAGVKVATMYCDRAGDITHEPWTTEKEDAPFTESQQPVWNEVQL